jgi:hypothetical protein
MSPIIIRFNRRFYPFNALRSLLGIGGEAESPTYRSFTMETGNTPRLAVMGDNRISMDLS